MSEDQQKIWEVFRSGLKELGVQLDDGQLKMFQIYLALLLEWNERMNLTAVKDPLEVIQKHFLDSLSLIRYMNLPQSASLVDVGSGAGFPGLPLKIAFPALRVTFLDSLKKRLIFLDAVVKELGLRDVRTLHARAEEAGRNKRERATYDFATARAVAALPVLSELCLPLLKTGGMFLAMKGPDIEKELHTAGHAIETMGGVVAGVKAFTLPGTDYGRSIVLIRKSKKTPDAYPRINAKIKEKPL